MSDRPSTTLRLPAIFGVDGSTQSLRGRPVLILGFAAPIFLGAVTYAGLVVLKKTMAGDEDARIVNAATLSTPISSG